MARSRIVLSSGLSVLAAVVAAPAFADGQPAPVRKIHVSAVCDEAHSTLAFHYSIQEHPGVKGEQAAHDYRAPQKMPLKDCKAAAKLYSDRAKSYTLNHFSSSFAQQIEDYVKAREA